MMNLFHAAEFFQNLFKDKLPDMDILNFFREDSGEILGIYYDEEKIFLARLTNQLELAEIDFEIDSGNTNPALFQLAEKIKLFGNQRGWQISKVGIVLREGAAVTLQNDFKNIPANEVLNAVKIWAVAHAKSNARYTFIKIGNEIWMEALNADIAEEYIAAFEKNSMQLCALTEIPSGLTDNDRPLTPFNRAVFAADIVKNNKLPNLLNVKVSAWNVKKISLTAAAIFFIALSGFSVNLASNYFPTVKRAKILQERFNSQDDTITLKNTLNANTGKIKRLSELISAQDINLKKFNALVKIGRIADGKIFLEKIKTSGETLELEGVAESQEVVKFYLNRLKVSVSPKVKLKNSAEIDGQIFFSISINLN